MYLCIFVYLFKEQRQVDILSPQREEGSANVWFVQENHIYFERSMELPWSVCLNICKKKINGVYLGSEGTGIAVSMMFSYGRDVSQTKVPLNWICLCLYGFCLCQTTIAPSTSFSSYSISLWSCWASSAPESQSLIHQTRETIGGTAAWPEQLHPVLENMKTTEHFQFSLTVQTELND